MLFKVPCEVPVVVKLPTDELVVDSVELPPLAPPLHPFEQLLAQSFLQASAQVPLQPP